MLNTLTWAKLRDPDTAGAVEALQAETLALMIGVSAGGYLTWHFASLLMNPALGADQAALLHRWLLFPVAVIGLGITAALVARRPRLAAVVFLTTSVLSVTAAIYLLQEPPLVLLYAFIALVAVVLFHPLAGLSAGAVAMGLLLLLRARGMLPVLTDEDLLQSGLGLFLTVAAGWALGRNMVIAVAWSVQSNARAMKNAAEARGHRAQLAQALKQLDYANYRLRQANAALELAWKAADAAERSKTEFVTNISHELRTPLNLIAGFSEMVLTSPESYDAPLPAVYRGDLNAIYRSAQHLLTLTDDVIDLARIGSGRLALLRESVDLGAIAEEACAIIREYVAAKGLWLRCTVRPGLPLCELDRLRIRQVLLNLLTNAARATERGGLTVDVGTDGERLIVTVADTGPGIPAVELPKVFDEFHQAEDGHGSEPIHKGYGLGLTISKRLVELHHGCIEVTSTLGSGTTFRVTLPASGASAPPRSGAHAPPERYTRRGERVLVLTGDDALAQYLQRHLRGYHVLAAPTLAEAVVLAVDARAQAIIADLDLRDAAEAEAAPTPVICLPLPHPERLAVALGAAACLAKPVRRADLLAAIARLDRPIRRVLVVDDDPRFVRLIRRYLRGVGHDYEVLSAHNGREALDLLRRDPPDLLLLDFVMPELDGREVLAALTADATLAAPPVIVISALEQGQGSLTLLGSLSVHKPEGFRLEELFNTLETLVGALDPPRRYLTAGGDLTPGPSP